MDPRTSPPWTTNTNMLNGSPYKGPYPGPSGFKQLIINTKLCYNKISNSNTFAAVTLVSMITLCFTTLIITFQILKQVSTEKNLPSLKFPTSLKVMQELDETIVGLAESAPFATFAFFCALYISKQTFSIPGSLLLNLAAGWLYPVYFAFPLICTLTMTGASCCFTVSKTIAKRALMYCCPDRIKSMSKTMEAQKGDLLWYLTFLRLVPMSPNWLINITAPLVGVPYITFAISVFVGLMPYNFICVQAGAILSTVKSMDDIFNTWTLIKLGSLSIFAVIPVIIKKVLLRRGSIHIQPILPR